MSLNGCCLLPRGHMIAFDYYLIITSLPYQLSAIVLSWCSHAITAVNSDRTIWSAQIQEITARQLGPSQAHAVHHQECAFNQIPAATALQTAQQQFFFFLSLTAYCNRHTTWPADGRHKIFRIARIRMAFYWIVLNEYHIIRFFDSLI